MKGKHPYLEVINVGQGDCMILRPGDGCCHNGKTFIIDTGNGKVDITRYLDEEDTQLSLILTHSHNDHIGGLFHLFPMANRIKEIILPFYYDEILLIAKALQNLRGIEKIAYDSRPISDLNEYEHNSAVVKKLTTSAVSAPKIVFAYEGYDGICDHFEFLNPPVFDVEDISPAKSATNTERVGKIVELFNKEFASRFRGWLLNGLAGWDNSDFSIVENALRRGENLTGGEPQARAQFVLSFFEKNYSMLQSFVQYQTLDKLTTVVKSLKLTANQASLVFRFHTQDCPEKTILFTGDIDTSVFTRLTKRKYDFNADVLKVPHHGSKTGLTKSILQKINPEYAIICHNNVKFGRAKDPHPNVEIINMLKLKGVKIFVTNNVIKEGKVVLENENSGKRTYTFELLG